MTRCEVKGSQPRKYQPRLYSKENWTLTWAEFFILELRVDNEQGKSLKNRCFGKHHCNSYYHSVYSCPLRCHLNSPTSSPPDCDPSTSLGECTHRVSRNRLKRIPYPGLPNTLFSATQRSLPFCFYGSKRERAPFVMTQIKDRQTCLRHCAALRAQLWYLCFLCRDDTIVKHFYHNLILSYVGLFWHFGTLINDWVSFSFLCHFSPPDKYTHILLWRK